MNGRDEGAAVYICGDEQHMAHDVHQALLDIIQEEGGMSREKRKASWQTCDRKNAISVTYIDFGLKGAYSAW